MEKIESNIIHSFQLAKNDIIRLQDNYMEMKRTQARILEKLAKLDSKKAKKPVKKKPAKKKKVVKAKKPVKAKKAKKVVKAKKPVKAKKAKKVEKPKTVRRSVRKTYVASKEGKKFHVSNCPFAQNIKPKTKVKFKTKTRPLNLGYKPCSCVK